MVLLSIFEFLLCLNRHPPISCFHLVKGTAAKFFRTFFKNHRLLHNLPFMRARDTVISRTLACCHFERSGSSAVAVPGEGGSAVEKSRSPPSRVAFESVPNAMVAGAIRRCPFILNNSLHTRSPEAHTPSTSYSATGSKHCVRQALGLFKKGELPQRRRGAEADGPLCGARRARWRALKWSRPSHAASKPWNADQPVFPNVGTLGVDFSRPWWPNIGCKRFSLAASRCLVYITQTACINQTSPLHLLHCSPCHGVRPVGSMLSTGIPIRLRGWLVWGSARVRAWKSCAGRIP